MPQGIAAGAALNLAPIQSAMLDTYDITYKPSHERLSRFVDLDQPSTDRSERYVYWTSVPTLVFQRYNDPIASKAYEGIRYEVTNHIFSRRIPWSKWDEEDDQTNAMLQHANQLGERAGQLREKLVFDVLNNSASADGLPSIPNAPDGVALFTTATRFGASGGNAFSTAVPSTVGDVHNAYYVGLEQFGEYQDTEGEPLHDGSVVEGGKTLIVCRNADKQIMEESFFQTRFQGSSAAPTNVLHDTNKGPDIWATQRVSGADAYMFLTESNKKPIFIQERTPFRMVAADDNNSDEARSTGQHAQQGELRLGIGLNLPYGAIQWLGA